ncbi:MAG: hypothetical protein WC705_01060 [Candidatus Paceibacterota bacterium]|jgi:hypothetical protein
MANKHIFQRKNLLSGLAFLFLFLLIFYLDFSFLNVKANLGLILVVSLGFFITDVFDFLLFLLLGSWLVKFSPFFSGEIVFLIIAGILTFFALKFLFFRRDLWIFILFVFIFQVIFWFIFGGFEHLNIFGFVVEFVYNGLLSCLFFFLGLWLEKRFF